jgi:signal transduction histidine kinase
VAVLCAVLGFLQYRWIGEVSLAERGRLHGDLWFALQNLSRALGPGDLDAAQLRELTARYLDAPGLADYEIEIVTTGPNPTVIFASNPSEKAVWREFDATEPLYDGSFNDRNAFGRRGPPPPDGRGFGRRGPPPPEQPGHKRLLARHKSGSLEALVAASQRRNLAVSGAILMLILGIAAALVTLTRRAQTLADAQIGFVAGVSHELRTPLTVIRTAAFNLRKPEFRDRAERYAELIAAESRKLEDLIDQVLRFASARAGHAVRELTPTEIGPLVVDEVDATPGEFAVTVEPGLPQVMADERALRHALHNLLDNAIRYGEGKQVSVTVRRATVNRFPHVSIEVADQGPGIPPEELSRVFDAFFRGSRAIRDQIHGTGLGLNIVKTIAEAHGGEAAVRSYPGEGAHFLLHLPCPENLTFNDSGNS